MKIRFIEVEDVLRYHSRLIELYGGSDGLRDMGLLQSALGMPMAQFGGEFLHPSVAEMAAAYLFHIVANHPFVDGNKRTGAAVARMFVLINNHSFDPDETEYGDMVLAVASGKLDKAGATVFFKKHVRASQARRKRRHSS
ncbi:MAG: type II toxin-antitoxin system death-on-curing family toxin [Tepidisphaeraceae bacterium]|jgi:death-on-curing protein